MDKKRSLLAITLIALLALLSACTPKQFKIQLHLKPGTTYHITSKIHQHFVQEFMGQKQDITQEMEIGYTWKVVDVDTNGNATVEMTYDHIAISQKQGKATNLQYDSAKDKKPPKEFAGLNLLVGKKFSVVFTPNGTVKKVIGLDEMFKQMEKESGLQGEELKRYHQSLTQTLGEKTLKDQFASTFGPYGDTPRQVGSKWSSDITLNSFFPITVHTEYTVKSLKGDQVAIEFQGTLASDPEQLYKLPMFNAKYDIKGTQQGTMSLNLKDGIPTEASVNQHMEGTIHLLDPTGSESIPLPVTVDTVMEMKAEK